MPYQLGDTPVEVANINQGWIFCQTLIATKYRNLLRVFQADILLYAFGLLGAEFERGM